MRQPLDHSQITAIFDVCNSSMNLPPSRNGESLHRFSKRLLHTGAGALVIDGMKKPFKYSSFAEYKVWRSMISRCRYAKSPRYKDYAGRGIVVCERWKHFPNFLEDMGCRPSPKLQIERKDNNGNYEPGNCVWATGSQNCRNTRRSKIIEWNGQRLPLVAWSEITGLPKSAIQKRVELGWSDERILSQAINPRIRNTNRLLTYSGKTHSVTDWAIQLGINRQTLFSRLFKGWTVEKTLTTLVRQALKSESAEPPTP